LPVLIVAGRDDGALAEAVARLVEDLADARIEVDQNARAGPDPAYEGRTVALLNRGVPGFAVDSDGTLHASLLRSCTGWPSGVWAAGGDRGGGSPRRGAPRRTGRTSSCSTGPTASSTRCAPATAIGARPASPWPAPSFRTRWWRCPPAPTRAAWPAAARCCAS